MSIARLARHRWVKLDGRGRGRGRGRVVRRGKSHASLAMPRKPMRARPRPRAR